MIHCVSLLAKVATLALSRILCLLGFAQPPGQVRGQVGLLIFYTVQKETPLSEKEAALIAHVKESIHNSWVGISQITEHTQREIEGISSSHVNHLLSSLCRFPHTRYLQIGLGAGHTFISALHKNHETIDYAVGIDNWLDGKRELFEKNRSQFLLDNQCNYRIYPSNCFSLDPKKYIAPPIN